LIYKGTISLSCFKSKSQQKMQGHNTRSVRELMMKYNVHGRITAGEIKKEFLAIDFAMSVMVGSDGFA